MELLRKVMITDEARIGDQIKLDLDGYGTYTATIHEVREDSYLCVFDECVVKMPMNEDLYTWLKGDFLNAFPEKIRKCIREISIPTYGMIFGHDKYYKAFKRDNDSQFPLMKMRKNRMADFKGDWSEYWLKNKLKASTVCFAGVNTGGSAEDYYILIDYGVRPYIILDKLEL